LGEKYYRRTTMRHLNIVVEGSSEETFVNDVLVKHFSQIGIYVATRKIKTGWDKVKQRSAKGGMVNYSKFKNDLTRWVDSDRNHPRYWYTSMIDLYAFPQGHDSPYTCHNG
jgi:hypothetical protein